MVPPDQEERGEMNYQPGDLTPRPDPTRLTSEQLHREISALESRIGVEATALRSLLEASIAGIKELLNEKVDAQENLDAERFSRIDARFNTNERHRIEQKEDIDKHLSYVIDTLKERADEHFKSNRVAIERSEQSIIAIIEKLSEAVDTKTGALSGKIDDVKERVGTVEASNRGAAAQRTEGRAQISSTTAIVGTVVAVIGIGLALLVGHNTATSPKTPTITTPTVTVTMPNP